MTQNLLVVDWDFFFPVCLPDGSPEGWLYDWGHSEAWSFMQTGIWQTRAMGFDIAGVARPRMNNDWTDFWDRFTFTDETTLFYADSNKRAIMPEVWSEQTGSLWLYDAHHDSGYRPKALKEYRADKQYSCEDWMVAYKLEQHTELHVRYPPWKTWAFDQEPKPLVAVDRAFDDGEANPVVFDTVFVCRSGAWVPPWCDDDFNDFITDAPVNELIELDDCSPREWDEEKVKQLGRLDALMKDNLINQTKKGNTQ